MPFSVELGLALAVATALSSIVGFLLKHRGAVAAPDVDLRRPVASTVALFRSPVYTLGCVVATSSWGLHVAALALAPISLVQSVIAGGLSLLTVVADRVFGLRVTRREWIGVALTAAGIAFLAATLEGGADSAHSAHDTLALALWVGGGTIAALALLPLVRRTPARSGLVLAASAGLLWGASDCSIKALSAHSSDGIAVLLHPLALVILVLSLVGLLVSARSLQIGPVLPVIIVTSATANVFTIASGPVVFGEPMPDDPLGLALRVLAFALVIGAAALTPPRMAKATDATAAPAAT